MQPRHSAHWCDQTDSELNVLILSWSNITQRGCIASRGPWSARCANQEWLIIATVRQPRESSDSASSPLVPLLDRQPCHLFLRDGDGTKSLQRITLTRTTVVCTFSDVYTPRSPSPTPVIHMLLIEEGKDYDNVDDANLPYTLVRNLGHGHSGNVEEVRDEVTKTLYARKIIHISTSRLNKQERTEVFHNEINIIRALGRHRHIITVFATYVTKRHFGIILQPVASDGDLEDFLAEYWNIVSELEGPVVHNARLEAMALVLENAFGCLAAGMAFMHDKKVRHKDIKPRNILVHRGLVVYTDFGYSFDSNGFSRSTTEGRPGFLTRKYSAPEVLNQDERNSKSDVYSLGCVFIDMLLALSLSLDPDTEVTCYSESMADIQERFTTLSIPVRYSFLLRTIKRMTCTLSVERVCAIDVVNTICTVPGFSCKSCAAPVFESYNGFVSGIETLTLKQKQPADEVGHGSQHKKSASRDLEAFAHAYNMLGRAERKLMEQNEKALAAEVRHQRFGNISSEQRANTGGAYNISTDPVDGGNGLSKGVYEGVARFLGFIHSGQPQRDHAAKRGEDTQKSGHENQSVRQQVQKKTLVSSKTKELKEDKTSITAHTKNNDHLHTSLRNREPFAEQIIERPHTTNAPPVFQPLSRATQWVWDPTAGDYYRWHCDKDGRVAYIWAKQEMAGESEVQTQHIPGNGNARGQAPAQVTPTFNPYIPLPYSGPDQHNTSRREPLEALGIFQAGRLFANFSYPKYRDRHENWMTGNVGHNMEHVRDTVALESPLFIVVKVNVEAHLIHVCPILDRQGREVYASNTNMVFHAGVYYSDHGPSMDYHPDPRASFTIQRTNPHNYLISTSGIWFKGLVMLDWNIDVYHIGSIVPTEMDKFNNLLSTAGLS